MPTRSLRGLGDRSGQAVGLGNAGAAVLLAGGPPSRAAADLRRSLDLAARVGRVGVQVEDLLRLAAAEQAQGHRQTAAYLYAAWRSLDPHWQTTSESNRRIISTFLADLASAPSDAANSARLIPVGEVVEVALGRRAVPPENQQAASAAQVDPAAT